MRQGRDMQSRRSETSFVFTLARSAERNIERGYYEGLKSSSERLERRSLKASISSSKLTPLIAEIKFTSPAEGKLRPVGDVESIARAYQRGGVCGISVLTEPEHFQGDIRYLPLVKRAVTVPVLMKDIIIDPLQIEAGASMGADAVLFIAAIFMNNLARVDLDEMMDSAHGLGLEVLFEAHTAEEYRFALESSADVVGINNRDLDTLRVSLDTSRRLLAIPRPTGRAAKLVISESGITSRREIEELADLGADGFLVGSTLMKSSNLAEKVGLLTGKTK